MTQGCKQLTKTVFNETDPDVSELNSDEGKDLPTSHPPKKAPVASPHEGLGPFPRWRTGTWKLVFVMKEPQKLFSFTTFPNMSFALEL